MTNELLNAIRSLVAWAKRADKDIYDEWTGPGEKYVQAGEITNIERLINCKEE